MFITRHGWPFVDYLMPEHWYCDKLYLKIGYRLAGGTGMVYRVTQKVKKYDTLDMVVKFSRFAQEVPLFVHDASAARISPLEIDSAKFASPFEEFALLEQLRATRLGAEKNRVLTKRPLAIYSPPEKVELWRSGRTMSRFMPHDQALHEDQEHLHPDPEHTVALDIEREYVLLFNWIDGSNAEDLVTAGMISQDEFFALTPRVTGDLAARGFRVLDNKPRHYILRKRADGSLLRRKGELVYALVDYELLEHLPANT